MKEETIAALNEQARLRDEATEAEANFKAAATEAFNNIMVDLRDELSEALEHVKLMPPEKLGQFGDRLAKIIAELGITTTTAKTKPKQNGLTDEQKAAHVGAGGGRKELTEGEVMAWFDEQEAGKKFQQQVVCNALGRAGTTVVKKLEKLKAAKKIDFEEKGTSKLWFKL